VWPKSYTSYLQIWSHLKLELSMSLCSTNRTLGDGDDEKKIFINIGTWRPLTNWFLSNMFLLTSWVRRTPIFLWQSPDFSRTWRIRESTNCSIVDGLKCVQTVSKASCKISCCVPLIETKSYPVQKRNNVPDNWLDASSVVPVIQNAILESAVRLSVVAPTRQSTVQDNESFQSYSF